MQNQIETLNGQPVTVDLSEFDRIRQQSPEHVNESIRRGIERNVRVYGSRGKLAISDRIDQLEQEWDVDRGVMVSFAVSTALFLLFGAAKKHSIWRMLLAAQLPFLIYHSMSGWCPPVSVLRRLGFRTHKEIDAEKYALKTLRGDYQMKS